MQTLFGPSFKINPLNYIGSKYKLLPFIETTIGKVVPEKLDKLVFCDLFAGSGVVSRYFKNKVKQILCNDWEYYSFVLNRNYIGNHISFDFEDAIKELNQLKGEPGFIFEEYSEGGKADRLYFSKENGQKIDAIRIQIEIWKQQGLITADVYFFLLASLIESADKVANTASVYGAYLKNLKKTALKTLELKPAIFENSSQQHLVFQKDSNVLIEKIEGDILYLDPPYNSRQYGANYHLLNSIARYETFAPKGKTGLNEYLKSNYCAKGKAIESLSNLLSKASFKYIFLSYNNEGLISENDIKAVMEALGTYQLFKQHYSRFKADKSENRNHKADHVSEHLHVLIKDE